MNVSLSNAAREMSAEEVTAPLSPYQGGTSSRWASSLICETPITMFQDSVTTPGAPKKCVVYLCRSQMPPSESLHEEWPLQASGMCGAWGYVFKYEEGELCFYQLKEGEMLTPSTVMVKMSFDDWGVMKTILQFGTDQSNSENPTTATQDKETQTVLIECKEEEVSVNIGSSAEDNPEGEHPRMDNYPSDSDLSKMNIVCGSTWPSVTTAVGRWWFQALLLSRDSETTRSCDLFVLQRFNTECGLFRTVLALPALEWADRLMEVGDRLTNLFHSSRGWKNTLVVKKTLNF